NRKISSCHWNPWRLESTKCRRFLRKIGGTDERPTRPYIRSMGDTVQVDADVRRVGIRLTVAPVFAARRKLLKQRCEVEAEQGAAVFDPGYCRSPGCPIEQPLR